jgi:hypothetical protein
MRETPPAGRSPPPAFRWPTAYKKQDNANLFLLIHLRMRETPPVGAAAAHRLRSVIVNTGMQKEQV